MSQGHCAGIALVLGLGQWMSQGHCAGIALVLGQWMSQGHCAGVVLVLGQWMSQPGMTLSSAVEVATIAVTASVVISLVSFLPAHLKAW